MEALFLKLVNMSLTASWLVLAVLIFRLVLKKAPKSIHCLLWGLVALRLIFPFSIESVLSLIPSTEPLPEEFLYAATPQVNTGISALNSVINPVVAETLTPAELTSANPTQIWSLIFSWVWVIGMAVMAVYALASYLLVRRKVAASIPVGKTIRLCDNIDTPFILGIFKPKIYLPSSIDQQTADHVLAHENAHLQRKDHWWKPLGFALLTVYWFNPVMWLAYILLCRDIEMACDEKVVKDLDTAHKKAYSQALLQCSVPRHLIVACPLAFGEVGVKSRIKSVLNYRKPAFWIIVVAVIACIVVAVCFLTDPAESGSVEIIDELARIENITSENGYTILNQATKNINITIPKSALPDSIYSEKGHTFGVNEIVVYETDTTVFYLDSVRFANEGENLLYFKFNTMYDLPEAGTITLLYEVVDEETTRHIMWVSLQSIMDGRKKYDDAVSIRGEDGGTSFTVYVNTEVCKAAEEYLSFQVDNFTDLTYAPEGYDPVDAALLVEKRLSSGSYVCSDCVYWPPYSSTLRPNTGPYNFLVYEDSISYYYSTSGTVFGEYTVDWHWQTLAQCYEDVFFYIEWYEEFASELSMDVPIPSEDTLYQKLDNEHFLIKSDGVVYMVEGTDQGKNAPLVYVDAIYRVGRIELTSGVTSAPTEEPVVTSLDDAIRAAILENNTTDNEGTFFESHTILSQLVGCGRESTDGGPVGYTKVYIIALVTQLEQTDGQNHLFRKMFPATLSFDEYTDGSLVLSDYQQPDENTDLIGYIQENFPLTAQEDLMTEEDYFVLLNQQCRDQAALYSLMESERLNGQRELEVFQNGYTVEIVDSEHHSNGVSLFVDITFPESISIVGNLDDLSPLSTNLIYTSSRGETQIPVSYSLTESQDRETNTVRYHFVFNLLDEAPTGNQFTLALEFRQLEESLTLSWEADVDDAKTFTAKSGDSEATLTISPYVVNVEFYNAGYNSISDLYDSITIWGKDGTILPVKGSHGGTSGGNLLRLQITLDNPVDIDNIRTVKVGGLTLE